MTAQTRDPWDFVEINENVEVPQKKASFDPWNDVEIEQDEGFLKSGARAALQVPQARLETTTPGLIASAWQLLAMGEILDPEEIEHIRTVSEREGIPFDEEEYMQAAQRALGTVPTVANIASKVEEKTGLPLEPKTRLQKFARFATGAGGMIPKQGAKTLLSDVPHPGTTFRGMTTNLPRPVLGAGVGLAKEGLTELGVPEPISDIASFGVLKTTPKGSESLVSQQKKPSGMTTRRYERLTEPTEVTGKKIKQIQRKTSQEVKGLAKDIIKETPISESYEKMKKDIGYKRGLEKGFEEVKVLAKDVPGEIELSNLKDKIKAKIGEKKGIKVTSTSKEKNKFLKEFIEDLDEGKVTIADLEERYRTNNRNASKSYDPGISWEANQAKRDAYFEYNQAIGEVFEEVAPNTEFLKQFRKKNAEWTSLMDAEMVDAFLEQMTKGRIRYEKGREFFKKKGMDSKFKRALGKEGFNKFETLLKDMMSTEEAASMLHKKADPGMLPFVKKALYFAVDPTLGKAKVGLDLIKGGYNKIFEMLLDKPEIAVNWDRGINALKRGDVKAANQELAKVAKVEQAITEKQAALKKYNQHLKQKESIPKTNKS